MAKPEVPEIFAAGTVLLRGSGRDVRVCLVHRPTQRDWSLPKGKLDPDEHAIAAAWRETIEESGQHVELGPGLPAQLYRVEGRLKRVDYWVGRLVAGGPGFRPNSEIDRLEWLRPEAAMKKLTYPRDRELIRRAVATPRTTPMIILRHAQALRRARWGKEKDSLRPLTSGGKRDARRLVNVLTAFGMDSVYSSDAQRCIDTVRPFARSARIKIRPESALSERGFETDQRPGSRRISQLLRVREPMVVCTHRPLLPRLLAELDSDLGSDLLSLLGPGLPPGAFIVLHRTFGPRDRVRLTAVERHEI
ncbi:MAG: NUDIX hydrolase [Candidatus Nanopelagicales bacterium]|nr:NUDIX hydrolase [Candidatus Nanopelagicales bacterium]